MENRFAALVTVVSPGMSRIRLLTLVVVIVFSQAGCTFARYSQSHVRVVDEQTGAGIPKARVRTFYVKPMLDMTYQRKDREKTDPWNRLIFVTDGTLLNWPRYIDDQRWFQKHVYPLVQQAGLR